MCVVRCACMRCVVAVNMRVCRQVHVCASMRVCVHVCMCEHMHGYAWVCCVYRCARTDMKAVSVTPLSSVENEALHEDSWTSESGKVGTRLEKFSRMAPLQQSGSSGSTDAGATPVPGLRVEGDGHRVQGNHHPYEHRVKKQDKCSLPTTSCCAFAR